MNLLFIQMNPERLNKAEPFVVAYNLDNSGNNKEQWRVDNVRGVEYGTCNAEQGMKGVWHYLNSGMWQQITQNQAYAKFPELQAAIEKAIVADKPKTEVVPW